MKVMVFVKANQDSETGMMPSEQLLTEMGQYNEELAKAGILLAGEGLHPSSKGVRVKFSGTERTVTQGPFTPAQELVAGYWLWQVNSIDFIGNKRLKLKSNVFLLCSQLSQLPCGAGSL